MLVVFLRTVSITVTFITDAPGAHQALDSAPYLKGAFGATSNLCDVRHTLSPPLHRMSYKVAGVSDCMGGLTFATESCITCNTEIAGLVGP